MTRAAMRRMGWSPSVRLFEAAACGTPIVSDPWRGLSDLLPEDSLVVAHGTEDVLRALALPEGQALALGRAARTRVLARHTGLARARELARALRPQDLAATGT
ncbi:hypothetical protein Rumeso_00082 [Rubellimicrobium mesophilum DSM 19309]|uniref:Spore protein YkvP/CgeB glycosyl transferase-like domain-containing protein n=1 Tax=Rubellimicrobium mesophilum DSM 19309 TaxID=442562 RepID=A0A017HVR0_9RHOB|nr:glycosyltransferase [Rubellimicrobium mesophilum]EYD78253.1 hypothetical protein Rumeso_00082 [Rubellimicrobium mesophilum DSM 19309]